MGRGIYTVELITNENKKIKVELKAYGVRYAKVEARKLYPLCTIIGVRTIKKHNNRARH